MTGRFAAAMRSASFAAFLAGRLLRSPASLGLVVLTVLGTVALHGFAPSPISFEVWVQGVVCRAGVAESVVQVESLGPDARSGVRLVLSSAEAAARLRPWLRRRHVHVEGAVAGGDPNGRGTLTITAPDPLAVPGLHRARILFGDGEVELADRAGDAVAFRVARRQVVRLLVRRGAGLLGLLVAVFLAAGLLPGILRRGAADLICPRALGRPGLLISAYLAGLGFCGVHAALLAFGLTAVGGLGFAGLEGLVLALGHVSALFACLLGIATLGAVLGRSRAVALVVCLTVWLAGTAAWSYVPAADLRSGADRVVDIEPLPPGLEQFLLAARLGLPHPQAIDARVDAAIEVQGSGFPAPPRKLPPSPYPALAAWAALSLLLAVLHLRRADL
ncbi:MAG: hypothetical protein ACYS22_07030 [Planctomycetota bacterium]